MLTSCSRAPRRAGVFSAHSNNRSHERGFRGASVRCYRPKTIKTLDRRERETIMLNSAQTMEAEAFFLQGQSDAGRDSCRTGFCFHNNRPIHVIHFRTSLALSIRSEASEWLFYLRAKNIRKKKSSAVTGSRECGALSTRRGSNPQL